MMLSHISQEIPSRLWRVRVIKFNRNVATRRFHDNLRVARLNARRSQNDRQQRTDEHPSYFQLWQLQIFRKHLRATTLGGNLADETSRTNSTQQPEPSR